MTKENIIVIFYHYCFRDNNKYSKETQFTRVEMTLFEIDKNNNIKKPFNLKFTNNGKETPSMMSLNLCPTNIPYSKNTALQ
jgi:hypothetical protein